MKNYLSEIGSAIQRKIRNIRDQFSGKRRKTYQPSGQPQGIGSGEFASRRQRHLNKKRFSTVAATIVAVVLVPVLVGATGNSANRADVENTLPPVNFQEPATVEDETTPQPEETESTPVDASILPEQQDTASSSESAEVTGEVAAVDPEPTPTPEPETQYMELVPETNHPDVIELQIRLTELNYMENDEPTDYYGPITQQAVKYFQRKHGLAVDGTAGVETQKLLFSDAAQPYSVTVGADGPDVEGIQQRLADLGYPVTVTGYFGTETETAVKYFQRMNGLDDDGSVGQYTKEMLYSKDAEPSTEYWEKKEAEDAANTDTEDDSTDDSSSDNSSSDNSSSNNDNSSSGSSDTETAPPAAEQTPAPESPAETPSAPAADPGSVEAFVNAALAQEGKKYVLGGKGPNSFDCSGLVYYALNQSGNSVGYMTSGGWAKSGYTTIGSVDELQRGDVICITGHVAIYLGDGMMVDASTSNGKVVVREVGSWARNNFICGKRPL